MVGCLFDQSSQEGQGRALVGSLADRSSTRESGDEFAAVQIPMTIKDRGYNGDSAFPSGGRMELRVGG